MYRRGPQKGDLKQPQTSLSLIPQLWQIVRHYTGCLRDKLRCADVYIKHNICLSVCGLQSIQCTWAMLTFFRSQVCLILCFWSTRDMVVVASVIEAPLLIPTSSKAETVSLIYMVFWITYQYCIGVLLPVLGRIHNAAPQYTAIGGMAWYICSNSKFHICAAEATIQDSRAFQAPSRYHKQDDGDKHLPSPIPRGQCAKF